jgi:hypothetical protein
MAPALWLLGDRDVNERRGPKNKTGQRRDAACPVQFIRNFLPALFLGILAASRVSSASGAGI